MFGLLPFGSVAASLITGWVLGEDGSRTADLAGFAGRGSGSLVTNARSGDSIDGTRSELIRITGETFLADIACCKFGDSRGACLLSLEDTLCLELSACGELWNCWGLAFAAGLCCCPVIECCLACCGELGNCIELEACLELGCNPGSATRVELEGCLELFREL